MLLMRAAAETSAGPRFGIRKTRRTVVQQASDPPAPAAGNHPWSCDHAWSVAFTSGANAGFQIPAAKRVSLTPEAEASALRG
jgi:hypothetical protein